MKRLFLPPFPDLGDFPTQAPGNWISGDQENAITQSALDENGTRILDIHLKNADVDQQGGRVALTLPNGQWNFFRSYLRDKIAYSYQIRIPNIELVDGATKWLTAGLEVKDGLSLNALIQTNVRRIGDRLYYWLPGVGTCHDPITSDYHTVSYIVDLAHSTYTFSYRNDYLCGNFTRKTDELAFILCMYGNNMPDAGVYSVQIKAPEAWVC